MDIQTLGALFRLSRDAVIGVKDGVVCFANPAAETLLGVQTGKPASKYLPEHILDDSAECFAASVSLGDGSTELTAVRADGLSLYTLPLRGEPPRDGVDPEAVTAVLGGVLMTDRLALDQLAARSGAEADSALRESAALLYRDHYRLKRLHSHLQLAAAIQKDGLRAEKRLLSLAELVGGVCDTTDRLARPSGRTVRFESAEDETPFLGDARLLETMLFNLLTNSLLHTDAGEIRVALTRQGARYMLALDDPGEGMSAGRLRELFTGAEETDLTDAAAGVGLGLAIARGVIRAHGGTILAESREGRGTRLRLSLPCPGPEELRRMRQPDTPYRTDGMDLALTELSVVLDKSFYTRKYFD